MLIGSESAYLQAIVFRVAAETFGKAVRYCNMVEKWGHELPQIDLPLGAFSADLKGLR